MRLARHRFTSSPRPALLLAVQLSFGWALLLKGTSAVAGPFEAPGLDRAGGNARERRAQEHWAFQPVTRSVPPGVTEPRAARGAVDAFLLAKLDAAGLTPSREAERTTQLRRLSLDLLGLPPTIEDLREFEADESPDAYERLLDRLLASPRYGERWGRHWLDLARYADSNGYTIDGSRSIWPYRDWVIAALNADMPFDRFTVEQIAGDLLPDATLETRVATGFHRNTLRNEEGGTDPEQFRVEAVVDRVATTGAVFLGLTLECARCHDHKYDPISQREFYQLFAFFNSSDEPELRIPTSASAAREEPAIAAELAQAEKLLAETDAGSGPRQAEWEAHLLAQLAAAKPVVPSLPGEVLEALRLPLAERDEEAAKLVREVFLRVDEQRIPVATRVADLKERLDEVRKSFARTLVVAERQSPRETFVHVRGDFLRKGASVEPDVPAVLPGLGAASAISGHTRLDLARWLVDARNPLTPRVLANQIWLHLFGRGIVATENDFGLRGEAPSHAELLDWLASRLLEDGWSRKRLLREIVTSAAYRQSSRTRPELTEADPYNRLLGRQARLRLEAEAIRDVELAAAGLLSSEIGGPGVYPPQPDGVYRFTQNAKRWKESEGGDRYRRGLYTFFWRSSPHPFLTTFDAPDGIVACTRRPRSTTPLQALTLANDRAFVEAARALAGRTLAEGGSRAADRARRAFLLVLSRTPSDREVSILLELVARERERFAREPAQAEAAAALSAPEGITAEESAAWTAAARVLLSLDEAITRE